MAGFWDRHNTSGLQFVDKSLAAENKVPFTITGVKLQPEGRYGPQWVVVCECDRNAGFSLNLDGAEEFQIGFPAGWRDEFMSDLREEITEAPVRAIVTSFTAKNGETGYALGPVPSEQLSLVGESDDIPF